MIIARTVIHAKSGAINRLVDSMKRATENMPDRPRILTDLSGPMNTMVLETRHESLAAFEKWRTELFQNPSIQESDAEQEELIDSGSNEFYTIEQE